MEREKCCFRSEVLSAGIGGADENSPLISSCKRVMGVRMRTGSEGMAERPAFSSGETGESTGSFADLWMSIP